ncbi:cyclopropane fatty-acyl-phospholipid synthase-like methyltransferase [Bradyrhizobium sp. AZCC 1578]
MTFLYPEAWLAIAASFPVLMAGAWVVQEQWRYRDCRLHLIRQYADLFGVEKEWRWSGMHCQRNVQDRLANFDRHRDEIERVLRKVYGGETALWMRRWRWFLLATAGLFGYAGGSEWGISHYRLKAP